MKLEELSDEQLQEKYNYLIEEYQFRAHEENGMEGHEEDNNLMEELSKVQKEIKRRKENAKDNKLSIEELSDEQLQEKYNYLMEEYQFRAHEENGMEGHEEDNNLMEELSKVQKEIKRRKENNTDKNQVNKGTETVSTKKEKTNNETKSQQKDNKGKNLPIRSFWEIYDSTCTEHCSTFLRNIHYLAKAPFFKMKGEDTVQKILSMSGNILSLPFKVLAKPINFFAKTDKKFDEMYLAISKLSPAELAVLTESPEDANKLFNTKIKDTRDKDYLSPTFMKQNKVNDLYLDVVLAVYKKQQQDVIDICNKEIVEISNRINELQFKVDLGRKLTIDEIDELARIGIIKDNLEKTGDMASHKAKLFEDGAKAKTSLFRNISGWFLARFNPDNRELNHEVAKIAEVRREALESDNQAEATLLTQKMDNLVQSETSIKQIGLNKNNTIDRGNTSVQDGKPCEMLDKGKSNKTRLLLQNIAIGAAIGRFVESMYNQQSIDSAIQENNVKINEVNEKNQAIHYENEKRIVNESDIEEATKDFSTTKVAAAHGVGEHSNLDARALENDLSWSKGLGTETYRVSDDALHAHTSSTMSEIEKSDSITGMEEAAKYYQNVQSQAREIYAQYNAEKGVFDYEGIIKAISGPETSDAMIRIFKNLGDGTIKISGDVMGTMQQEMSNINLSNLSDYVLLAAIGSGIIQAHEKDLKENNKIKEAMTQKADKRIEKEEAKSTDDEGER